jgi:alkaline phosphatase D
VRLAQYRSDPLLHNMHAQCPWLVTLDDHEVDNNWAGEISEEKDIPVADFLLRRAAAFQAYYEMMPLRARSLPRGPHMRLYRNAVYGQLANLMVLDTRQYRTDQANDDRASILNDAAMDRANTLLGDEQHNWLCAKLIESPSTWNVLAQQVMMGMAGFSRDGGSLTYSMDQWSGYAHERMRMMSFLADRRIPNPIVVTGDIHSNWVNDLRVDDRVPSANIVATEFVGTSLSSGGNGTEKPRHLDQILLNNPCVKFHNGERGYVRCTVTPTIWKSDYVVVDEVTKPGGQIFDRASFVVEAGKPGVRPA